MLDPSMSAEAVLKTRRKVDALRPVKQRMRDLAAMADRRALRAVVPAPPPDNVQRTVYSIRPTEYRCTAYGV